jgi:hypothetical protein
MSWKKHFKTVNLSPLTNAGSNSADASAKYSNYASHLPEVYTGHTNRIERYSQYENMDVDSEVNSALDILSEFCTQVNVENGTAFDIYWSEAPSDSEIDTIKKQLLNWNNVNEFNKRVFKIFRNTLKYGDQVFVRDPETFQWSWVEMTDVNKVIVNESEGKKPEQYVIKNVNFNFKDGIATTPYVNNGNMSPAGGGQYQSSSAAGGAKGIVGATGSMSGSRFSTDDSEFTVDADHVVHLSLSEGLDNNYPFGNSLLETIFKVYKQKELLEDAIIIYRVQRAPERRVFYVDVGNMPSHLAMQFVERVKTEIHQRRIPSSTGGGANVIDSSYNPLSINEDYFFPQTAEGRGSKVETLPGGTNLGEIDDLRYFTNKLVRGLRIPSSYLPTGADDASSSYNDGRVGTAYIQELRFNTYCERLQGLVVEEFNQEFKRYLLENGVNIDTSMFDLAFEPPQNFASYRQSELDNARIPTFTQMSAIPYISNRFAMKRFLGMSAEEIAENERMWKEENDETLNTAGEDASAEMRGAGISGAGISSDLDSAEDILPDDTEGELGADAAQPETATGDTAAPAAPATDQTI